MSIKVQDTDVYDMHRGEMFGTKSIVKDGVAVASANLSIVGKEVRIAFIQSVQRRQGYATALVDDLFREYEGYKIFLTNMTEDGSRFFRASYDVGGSGELARKSRGGEIALSLEASQASQLTQERRAAKVREEIGEGKEKRKPRTR